MTSKRHLQIEVDELRTELDELREVIALGDKVIEQRNFEIASLEGESCAWHNECVSLQKELDEKKADIHQALVVLGVEDYT